MASLIDEAKKLFKKLETKAAPLNQAAQKYAPQLIAAGGRIPLPFAQWAVPKVQQNFAIPYANEQIYQPIRQGLQAAFAPNQTPLNRGLGGLQAGMGAFSATPAGVGFNILSGYGAGVARSLRTGQPMTQSVQQAITTPTSLGGEGLGIKNPMIAMGVDIAAGNPKAILKAPKSILKAVQGKAGTTKQVGQIAEAVQKAGVKAPQIPPASPLAEIRQTVLNGTSGGGVGKPVGNSSKYAFNINKSRLQLSGVEKKALTNTVNVIKPELEKIKGKTLSNDEVLKAAKTSDMLTQVTSREQTLAAEAATLRARQRMVELDKEVTQLAKVGNTPVLQEKMRDLVESLRVVSSNAAETGRKLQALSISAGDESVRMQVLKDVSKVSNNTDEILKAADGVDWNNADSITKFYRKFVKPTIPEMLDEFRYNNMLSSPKTHIRNAFSNLTQTFISRPATLVAEGRPIEAVKYLGGTARNIPKAMKAFADSFKGKTLIEKPDLERIPTGLPKFLTIPTKLMEAGDRFFSTLIEGGEMARGKDLKSAQKAAAYFLFRQDLKPEGQGKLLNAIDDLTAWTYKAPKVVRWFVPFIRTPMNFAKQWIEYSPMGLATLPGAANKREQMAKVILGSVTTAVGANLALEGRTTWATPTDPKQKELFYASGKKPFSILIGDKWVPMITAGPFAFALALPAAAKFYQEDSKTALTDSELEKLGRISTSMAEFLSGQTFLGGMENFVKWASGDADYTVEKNLAYTTGQLIPFQGLLRYISTIMDPIYRKPQGFGEQLLSGIPGYSQDMEAYTDPTGQPSKRLPENYYIPYDVGNRQPEYERQYESRTDKLQTNSIFTEDLRAFESLDDQIKTFAEAGDKQQVVKLITENRDMLLKGKITKEFKKRYERYYRDMNVVQQSDKLTPEQRGKLLDAIQAKIKELDQGYAKFKSN